MAREKCITLFNKNHITIKKYENRKWQHGNVYKTVYTGGQMYIPKGNGEYITVKKISKLAPFYYETKEYKAPKDVITNGVTESVKVICYIDGGNNIEYEIMYYIKYGDTSVSHETRPWDCVAGDGIFEEHFITDLQKVLEDIFEGVNINYISFSDSEYSSSRTKEGSIVRIDIMKSLFGDKDGFKHQTNESKILSHGFDLKTSFRKPKQE